MDGELSLIDEINLSGSEEEQVQYLHWLLDQTDRIDLEFINWIFLNDPIKWQNGVDQDQFVVFDSVGLRDNSGQPKEVWNLWMKEVAVGR